MDTTNQVEVDMGTITRVFQYASDTIVEASQLRRDFGQLRVEFDALRESMERLRRQNEFLDEQLVQVREQRDSANRRANELEATLGERNRENTAQAETILANNAKIDYITSERERACKERDDAQLRVLELEEENKKLNEQLANIQLTIGSLQKILNPVQQAESPDMSLRQPGETEEEHRQRTQPRDPVTQQWRSPYEEQAIAAKGDDPIFS